jgi:hypothetical protein
VDEGYHQTRHVLLYIDNCLAIHHDGTSVLKQIDKYFPMKPGSIGSLDIYLGSKLREVTLDNGVSTWGMSPSKYVQESVQNIEKYMQKLPKKAASGPWPSNYASEMNASDELDAEMSSYYQSQIGVLHWIVELGRVDIMTEVSTLASHMALPREGHLDAVFSIFRYYLKRRHNS